MKSTRARLDTFISRHGEMSKREVRHCLLQQQIMVDGLIATAMDQIIHQFSVVSLQGKIIQQNTPTYIVLNKPKGVVSSTTDKNHTTVIDIIDGPRKEELHIVGRLDFNTTGLLLLTNDGRWSRRLSLPENNIQKKYRVTLEQAITTEYATTFVQGIYFRHENITTRPAELEVLSPHIVELTICEGRYHQVKRMFGYFQNKVLELHRLAVGNLPLDPKLSLGASRSLTELEVKDIFPS
ncbi:MAG: 16S rRNA pseudouridine516 synthase [Candidatus Endobugula sp.]|jgi:16S rRNA pseudouridine516 synthase